MPKERNKNWPSREAVAAAREREATPSVDRGLLRVSDIEGLLHARARVADPVCVPGTDTRIVHALDSRALSELDRLIDQARARIAGWK